MGKVKSGCRVFETTAVLRRRWLVFAQAVRVFFQPLRLFDGYPWRGIWEARERRLVVVMSRAWLILAAIAYAAHYPFFDRVEQLQPLQFWLFFRAAMGAMLLATALLYASP